MKNLKSFTKEVIFFSIVERRHTFCRKITRYFQYSASMPKHITSNCFMCVVVLKILCVVIFHRNVCLVKNQQILHVVDVLLTETISHTLRNKHT